MSRATDQINKVTGTVISLSWKLILIAVIILLVVQGAAKGYHFGYEVFAAEPMEKAPGHDITITVSSDESDLDVLNDMKDEGLIGNSYAALVSVIFFEYKIYPGTYTLNTSMTPREMLDVMSVRPEGYVEETNPAAVEETLPPATTAAAAADNVEVYYDEEPSEMVWEAVEAEIEPETEPEEITYGDEDVILDEEASEGIIEIQIE